MRSTLPQLLRCDSGVTVIEYAFIAVLISVAIFGAVSQVGSSVSNAFTQIASGF